MAGMPVQSKCWSCSTLDEGIKHVLRDAKMEDADDGFQLALPVAAVPEVQPSADEDLQLAVPEVEPSADEQLQLATPAPSMQETLPAKELKALGLCGDPVGDGKGIDGAVEDDEYFAEPFLQSLRLLINSDDEQLQNFDQEDDESLKARLTGTLGVKPEKLSEECSGAAKRPVPTPARAAEPFPKKQRKIPTRQDLLRANSRFLERLLVASKARISRMCAPKSRRKELEVPDFVKQHWLANKDEMGRLLLDLNFDKAKFISQLEVIISRKQKYTIVVDQGWYTKDEMVNELKWLMLFDVCGSLLRKRVLAAMKYCESQPDTHVRQNLYDGEKEFWAKEDAPQLPENCFKGLEKMQNRAAADEKKAIDTLEKDIRGLDDLYDKGQELVVSSGLEGYGRKAKLTFEMLLSSPGLIGRAICQSAASVCSRATASEQKIRLLVPKLVSSLEETSAKPFFDKQVSQTRPKVKPSPKKPAAKKDENQTDTVAVPVCTPECTTVACISYKLPAAGVTPGKVLRHCSMQLEKLLHDKGPLIFKIGYTHDAIWRWTNTLYGYIHDADGWTDMLILYATDEPYSPGMLEACLIDKFAIQLSMLGENDLAFPILKLRDWGQFLADKHCLHLLVGLAKPDLKREQNICEEFWAKHKKLYPDHEIYERFAQGSLDPKLTYPFVYHGDEGRGRRRTPFLVGNFHSLMGKGTQEQCGQPRPYLKLRMNFRDSSLVTRLLHCAVPKKLHQQSHIFDALMESVATEAEFMVNNGVVQNYTGFLRSDWCHGRLALASSQRCAAGTEGIPWETVHERDPLWLGTTFSVSGFVKVPAVARLLSVRGQEEDLLRFDFFHAFHLGVGKHFLGSCLALWSTYFAGGNVDLRFEALESAFFTWCRAHKEVPVLTRLTKETVQWPSTLDYPAASWFKGAVTTVVFKFLESTMCQQNWSQEPMLQKAAEAIQSINKCLAALYASDLFIEPGRAIQIAEDGLRFLRRLAWLAKQAAKDGRALWLLTPKTHIMHHLLLEDLLLPARKGISPFNPLCWSVQMDEDFVGFSSRLARRVDPRTCSKRCIERYLYAAYAQYVKAKYIVPRS
ncbi:unnamed protein product [Symbiodinium sp. CCMP2592]|nr:unnamed protein product [Symbiodinium sp. CCMP2592]